MNDEPLLSRADIEIVAAAGGIAGAIGTGILYQTRDSYASLLSGVATFFAVVGFAYGALVARRASDGFEPFAFPHTITPPNHPPAEDPADAPDADGVSKLQNDHAWRVAILRFLLAGKWSGSYSLRALGPNPKRGTPGYMSDSAWRKISAVLRAWGILVQDPIVGLSLAPGWSYARAVFTVKNYAPELPDSPAPTVKLGAK